MYKSLIFWRLPRIHYDRRHFYLQPYTIYIRPRFRKLGLYFFLSQHRSTAAIYQAFYDYSNLESLRHNPIFSANVNKTPVVFDTEPALSWTETWNKLLSNVILLVYYIKLFTLQTIVFRILHILFMLTFSGSERIFINNFQPCFSCFYPEINK